MTEITPEMTAAQIRAEVLRRVAESDLLFGQFDQLTAIDQGEFHPIYNRACHLRQTAAALAPLAGAPDPVKFTSKPTSATDGGPKQGDPA